jgi:hypothetical protein
MVRCAPGARNGSFRLPPRRGARAGRSKPRPLFAFSNNGRAEIWLGASRASGTSPRRLPGSGCVVVRALGHAPLHGRKWPFQEVLYSVSLPGGGRWGAGGDWRACGGQGVCLRRSAGLKRASVQETH